jgi:thiamine kinase-like enzyme
LFYWLLAIVRYSLSKSDGEEEFMIPMEKNEAVTRGLREAFGVGEFELVSRMSGGHYSLSLMFRIVVRGRPYLLKIITRADDPTRHYASMKAGAEAGIAPRVWYTNVQDKISITDFVEARPLSLAEALVRLPAVLRRLHALPSFGRASFNTTCTFLLNKGVALDGYLQKFRASNSMGNESEEFFVRYAELAAVYPNVDVEMVSSHNDLFRPDNILFDGEQVWLVDWEAAFLNDRYADLAVVANQVVTSEEDEMIFLRKYFGNAPDEYQRARLHLMQQLAHLFYTMAFISLGAEGKPIDWSGMVPEHREYNRLIWAGKIDLTNKAVKNVYGRVHWDRLRQNVRQVRYREALRIVSERKANR